MGSVQVCFNLMSKSVCLCYFCFVTNSTAGKLLYFGQLLIHQITVSL